MSEYFLLYYILLVLAYFYSFERSIRRHFQIVYFFFLREASHSSTKNLRQVIIPLQTRTNRTLSSIIFLLIKIHTANRKR